MSVESAPVELERIADRLAQAQVLLLTTHIHPDGDGLGAMLALAGGARRVGKTPHLLLPDGVPDRYEFLAEGNPIVGLEEAQALAEKADVILVLDTHAQAQLEGLWEILISRQEKVIVIDHHPTGAPLGTLGWVDTSASAVGVQALELLEALGWPLGQEEYQALAAAITSDTGWLRFENTDARTLRAMSRLVEAGVAPDKLYARLYQQDRPERLALLARAVGSLELYDDQRIAVMQILQEDFRRTGAREEETENLVNQSLQIPSVQVAIMLVEQAQRVRVNLRSRGQVDVSHIARSFGGGGHARAAGLRSDLPLGALRDKLIQAAREALGA